MKEERKGLLADILSRRKNLLKLISVALLLAFGTSILASYITTLFENREIALLIMGIVIICIVLVYLICSLLRSCNRTISISGLLVFKKESNDVVRIDRYKLSEKLEDTLSAVFLENEALKKHWEEKLGESSGEIVYELFNNNSKENNNVGYSSIVKVETSDKKKKSKSYKILDEALEYLIIEELSDHLSTYFNGYYFSDKLIKKYSIADFPKILLENRIINLLSTPFIDRAKFAKANLLDKLEKGEIIKIFGTDGSRFSKFDLILPTGTKVERDNNGILILDNTKMTLEINIKNEGYSDNFPRSFEYYYLGIPDNSNIVTRKISIEVNSKIKFQALFFSKGWEYYKWIDSFIEDLEEFASLSKFIKNIEWESNLTRIIVSNNRTRIRNQIAKDKRKNNELPLKKHKAVKIKANE